MTNILRGITIRHQNEALRIANEIFGNGRIQDPEDWEEMKNELWEELDDLNYTEDEIEIMIATVKEKWY